MVHYGSGECLVQNNIFDNLRHSMILQAGANGNVFAYNYSQNPFWTGVSGPSNAAGDLVLHGNYTYTNLLEGNIVQNIVIDDSHGINGPFNTFFRNRAELFGLFMNNNPASSQQNFIGNEITNNGLLYGMYNLEGTDHFEFGNNDYGTILPPGTSSLAESSLFLTEVPDYLDEAAWPPIGIPNELDENSNAAKNRYAQDKKTDCSSSVITSTEEATLKATVIKLFPNPTSDLVQIQTPTGQAVIGVTLYNAKGQQISHLSNTEAIDLSHVGKGLYVARILLQDHQIISRKIIKQ